MELNLGSDHADNRESSVTMMASGYDKSLPEDDLKSLLSDHFYSCGEVTKVYIPNDVPIRIRNKYAFIYITGGEDAEEKALQLDGSDFGGRNLRVEVMPPSTQFWTATPTGAAMMADLNEQLRREFTVMVTGYTTLIPVEDVKSALTKHFSSCGEVFSVTVFGEKSNGLNMKALVWIVGDGVADKAQGLSGTDMGGWNVQVLHCQSAREVKHDITHD